MKDYRLSEIKNHDWNENWDVSDDITKGHREYEFLRELQHDLGIYDIKPRDMIELPSMHKVDWKYSDDSVKYVTYDVIFRDKYGNIQIVHDFTDEERAKQFLQELKNGKSN